MWRAGEGGGRSLQFARGGGGSIAADFGSGLTTCPSWGREGDARGEMLIIDGHPVMEQWEKPYMFKLGEVATRNGGCVLEVGFGLGLSATSIQVQIFIWHQIL